MTQPVTHSVRRYATETSSRDAKGYRSKMMTYNFRCSCGTHGAFETRAARERAADSHLQSGLSA